MQVNPEATLKEQMEPKYISCPIIGSSTQPYIGLLLPQNVKSGTVKEINCLGINAETTNYPVIVGTSGGGEANIYYFICMDEPLRTNIRTYSSLALVECTY